MIHELQFNSYKKVKPLLKGLEQHPVINGVIDGNNRGKIYVDNPDTPTAVFIWAINEMFYLIGDSHNQKFNSFLEEFIINKITPEARQIGEEDFNLELYPFEEWNKNLRNIFNTPLNLGERVPFTFEKERFMQLPPMRAIHPGYELKKITQEVIAEDPEEILANEILKFWDSLDNFLSQGIGYCVTKDQQVIGTCLSVFNTKNEYEIGINTYDTGHRGKGLASAMATAFIEECLESGGIPHWTTEDFRKDSIAIATKLGFEQLPNYNVFYFPFEGFRNLTQVKVAEPSELADILEIDEAVIGNESRKEYLKEAIATKKCLVAKKGSLIVGFLTYNTHFFECSFISLVIVHPSERRKGYAKALLSHFEGIAPTQKIFSSTNQSNVKMQKVFEAMGYVKSGYIDNLDEGDLEMVYFKTISETKSSKSRNT